MARTRRLPLLPRRRSDWRIFYYKAKPFLHFHEKDGARWADVRDVGLGFPEGQKKAVRAAIQASPYLKEMF